MNYLKWYGCSAHLVNFAFGHTRCAADQFINCAEFDELRNLVNRAVHLPAIGLGLRLRLGLGSGLGSVLESGLGLRNLPNAQRVWSNAQIYHMARLTWLGVCFQISRNMLKFWVGPNVGKLVCMVILTFLEINLSTAGGRIMVWLPCDGEGMQLHYTAQIA